MKLATYEKDGIRYAGIVSADMTAVTPVRALGLDYADMNELIRRVTAEELTELESQIASNEFAAASVPLAEVKLLAPIPHPDQEVICLGVNYMDHAWESARYKKEDFNGERPYPVYFCKRVNECTPDGGYIDGHFDLQQNLDYEAELAVILGKDALNVKAEDAYDYVFGYTIINDVSSRDLQARHKQFYFAKSLDTFTCMGPWIVTADDLPCPPVLHISSKVNDELRQDNTTGNMIFDIPYIIAELSSGMMLRAGTVISTGTPSGVGMGFTPPKFMKSGDKVECIIEGIGSLTNYVK